MQRQFTRTTVGVKVSQCAQTFFTCSVWETRPGPLTAPTGCIQSQVQGHFRLQLGLSRATYRSNWTHWHYPDLILQHKEVFTQPDESTHICPFQISKLIRVNKQYGYELKLQPPVLSDDTDMRLGRWSLQDLLR